MAAQEAQESPPSERVAPPPSLLREEKEEGIRLTLVLAQLGQQAGASDWAMDLRSWNLCPHWWQRYS